MPSDGDTTLVYLCHFNVYSLWDLPLQQDSACATEQLHAEHSLSIGCHCMPWAVLWSLGAVNTMHCMLASYSNMHDGSWILGFSN